MNMVNKILSCLILFFASIDADRLALNRNMAVMLKQYQMSYGMNQSHHDNVIKFLMQNHNYGRLQSFLRAAKRNSRSQS